MKIVDVLIVVDASGTLASGSLDGNAYLIDTNGFLGSWSEGSSALHTVVQDADLIQWAVVPVSVADDVSIAGFSGVMVDRKVCLPQPETADGAPWLGRVASQGQFAAFPYLVTVSVGGKSFSLTATVKVV